ncbi:peptidoglycan DD-metalloendopeptidase family protein [Devosia rhodophyticola]|uniref:Peptidoglycan DD-metalloendopeptidase family protein n=1 Tax=Devosia rhodophyticola TaxID=3026423 RepID=A0ABY7YTZ2_9HYPH|nr:peptidoglycan DD-metalloendopeptidase family protein [Devosia rhodophyticola]WDR04726.1 peptidoglycan DD-metalloendopeptidase family protein [Devosia rhodophyticola]
MSGRANTRLGLLAAGVVLGLCLSGPLYAQDVTSSETETTPSANEPALPTEENAAPSDAASENAEAQPNQTSSQTEAEREDALEQVEKSISLSQDRVDALKREIADMEGDRTRQNAALIAAGQRVKLAEIEVADVETRLNDLIVQEFEVRGRLDGADTEIANVLAALQRISLNPPPALIVDPADALGSARSAMLIASIAPQLRAKAEAVSADLKHLTEIKQEAQKEEQLLKANHAVLEEEQLRIATLILARKQGVSVMTDELRAEEQAAIELATRAKTLKELIDKLGERMTSVNEAVNAAATTSPAGETVTLSTAAIKMALANTARTEPAIPFSAARGYLNMPANGVDVREYGASDGFGGIAHGTSVVTRADAQVVAPADGWVLYTGPYLNYGQIVIINTGQNYTVLLAGLEKVTATIGQFVLMGEPIGTMGSRTIGRTITTSAGNSQPTLYIELRKDNAPIDPTGWWAPPSNTTQSG